jgi:hypothetical protein
MHKMRLLLTIAVLGFLSACGGQGNSGGNTDPADPPTPDSVSGTVTYNGTPVSNAQVTAFITNSNAIYQVTTTDANGNYSFSGMSVTGNVAGEYQFWATKKGYGFYPSVGNGAKVTRADYTGQFPSIIAIYFTVIDYFALPNSPLTGANFAAYDGNNPLVTLAATGQQSTYAAGDDGSIEKGVAWNAATRFTDNQNGTVTDNLTGLIWLKDGGCLGTATWASGIAAVNQLASGACGLSDNSKAGQWRMPNLNELESLVDVSESDPALSAGNPFENVSNGIYWTSTSYWGGETGSPDAWSVRLSDGRYINDSTLNVKATSSNAVWAVRGAGGGAIKLQSTGMYVPYVTGDDGSLQTGVPPTFSRWIDNGNGTITDTVTGLVWLKQANCMSGQWADAVAAVNQLASGKCGLTDNSVAGQWRMPNRREMLSLSDRMETNHADFFNQTYQTPYSTLNQAAVFADFVVSDFYWTSTTDAASTTEAWTVYSCDYGVYDTPKTYTEYTLSVR